METLRFSGLPDKKGVGDMMTGSASAKTTFGPVQLGVIALTLATALIHFYLNVLMGKLDLLFTLNGLGYLGLLAALFAPIPLAVRYRPLIRFAMMLFTLVTIVAWAIMGERSLLGYVDKGIEIALLVLLWLDRARG